MDPIAFLKDLSPSQRLMWIGNAGMAVSAVSTGIFGVQIVAGMNIYVFAAGAVFSILGWYGSESDRKRRFELKMEDARLREKKLDAGLDPNLDKTIIRTQDD